MTDLIDRQAAIDAVAFGITYAKVFDKETGKVKVKELFAEGNYELKNAIDRIKELPSAEPELIRCKECKHYNAGFECLIEGYGIERDKDWFCGSAERKKEDD